MKTYNKLVRDLIPQIIEATGQTPVTRNLTDKEYITELKRKLQEETNEYLESGEIMELCDIIEVVYALSEATDVGIDELHLLREKKAEANGKFKQKIYLESVF
ncbi:MAG: nucleoside triphosphate pyrophosphohydrolase [Oscillospiraceae bacterium]|jgi:predicted house-cleaning noncanonical NTP pyrophosphatase (MazG superfamily)|nr:nucleoside triphosphate pyrophosphohydrolase [Oscillospiraceae bacterium]